MNTKRIFSILGMFALLAVLTALLAGCGASTTTSPLITTPSANVPGPDTVSYSKDVAPIMAAACNDCHGTKRISEGLDTRTYAGLMAGSQSGAVIVEGKADTSMLYRQILTGRMPKRGTKLTSDQIWTIKNWIDGGAKDN